MGKKARITILSHSTFNNHKKIIILIKKKEKMTTRKFLRLIIKISVVYLFCPLEKNVVFFILLLLFSSSSLFIEYWWVAREYKFNYSLSFYIYICKQWAEKRNNNRVIDEQNASFLNNYLKWHNKQQKKHNLPLRMFVGPIQFIAIHCK